jgi:hypothetical protein
MKVKAKKDAVAVPAAVTVSIVPAATTRTRLNLDIFVQ